MASGEYNDAPRTSDILRGGSTSVADRLMRSISREGSHDRRFSNDGSFNSAGDRAPRGASFMLYEAAVPNHSDHPDYYDNQKVSSSSAAKNKQRQSMIVIDFCWNKLYVYVVT